MKLPRLLPHPNSTSIVAERPSYKPGHTHKSKDAPDISPHSYLLPPWRYITGALGSGHMIDHVKRIVSRLLYEYLEQRYPQTEWTTMNYGYAAIDPPFPVIAADSPEQFTLQLYWYVARLGPQPETFSNREVREIASGRGDGATFIAHTLKPKMLTGLDFSSSATAPARTRYQSDGSLEYVQGDAGNLFFEPARFDLVLNFKSADCYGSIARFVSEVHRVLRPGGASLFPDSL